MTLGAAPAVYRWRGQGWLPNIPARDLTAADVAALDPVAWAEALALDAYEEIA